MTLSNSSSCKKPNMRNLLPSSSNQKKTKSADSAAPTDAWGFNKSRIYNLEQRRKTDELLRKDLISMMKVPDSETFNRDDYLVITNSWREEWEKGVQVPVNPEGVPKANVRKFDLKHSLAEHHLSHLPSTSNGNGSSSRSNFKLPKEFIKALDIKTNQSSNYQLDATDISWLKSMAESELALVINDNFLEDVINELEQQCALNIQEKQLGIEYSDNVLCDVCQSPETEDGNEMVFCDRCNICVHQACYGITEIPDDEWLCSPCRSNLKKSPVCALCPNLNGAFKMTTDNRWVHVICVNWIPEAKFKQPDLMEMADISSIPSWKKDMTCSLCNVKGKGVSIKCDEKNCRVTYHATCGIKHKIKMIVQVFTPKYTGMEKHFRLKSFCPKHSIDKKPVSDEYVSEYDYTGYLPSHEGHSNESHTSDDNNRENLQHKFWKFIDINNIFQEISSRYSIGKSKAQNGSIVKDHLVTKKSLHQLIDIIYNYWKLKRISNYGHSLIKPTFAQKFQEKNQLERTRFKNLRYQMENLRNLIYMSLRRERIKKSVVEAQKKSIEAAFKLFYKADNATPDCIASNIDMTNLSEAEERLLLQIIDLDNYYSRPRLLMPDGSIKEDAYQMDEQEAEVKLDDQPSTSFDPSQPSTSGTSTGGGSSRRSSAVANIAPGDENSEDKLYLKMTNQILRTLKRFKLRPRPMTNPYAKVYLNSTNKRKVSESEEVAEAEPVVSKPKRFRRLIEEFDAQQQQPPAPPPSSSSQGPSSKTDISKFVTVLRNKGKPQQHRLISSSSNRATSSSIPSTVMVTLRRRDANSTAGSLATTRSDLTDTMILRGGNGGAFKLETAPGYNFRVTSPHPPVCNVIPVLKSSNRTPVDSSTTTTTTTTTPKVLVNGTADGGGGGDAGLTNGLLKVNKKRITLDNNNNQRQQQASPKVRAVVSSPTTHSNHRAVRSQQQQQQPQQSSPMVNGIGKSRTLATSSSGGGGALPRYNFSMVRQHFRTRSFGTSPRSLPATPSALKGQQVNSSSSNQRKRN